MKINFKTGGLLSEILPTGASDDQAVLDMPEGATIVDVMTDLGLAEDEFYLVILNDVVCPKAARSQTVLNDGDELGIFPPLKGG